MQFLNPVFLFLALLGILPVLLYFFRRRSRTVPVSTLVFFKSLAKEHQESAWLRRMKKLLSLLLTLLILFGVVGALARLVVAPRVEELDSVVVVLDRSASMAAVDSEGLTRLDAAREEIRARLAGLRETVGVSLVIYDSRVEIALPKTLKRRQFLSELDRVTTRPLVDDRGEALAVAKMIAEIDRPAQIWLCSDRASAGRGGESEENGEAGELEVEFDTKALGGEIAMPEGVALQRISVALPASINVGITAFQVRKVPLMHSGYEAYIQVSAAQGNGDSVEAELEVTLGGAPMQIRNLELEPGEREGIILPITGVAGQVLRVKIRLPGDCFDADDEVIAKLPEIRPVIAAWISEESDPFTELALSSIVEEGELELWKGGPETWPVSDQVDLVIFDGWMPDSWPTDLPAIVINPPGGSGPVKAIPLESGGIPQENIRVANAEHPLLYRVSTSRVALTQTAIVDASGSLEPLWFAGSEPVLVAGEVKGQRLVVLGFSPELSEWLPLTASYPLLLGNAVFWCMESTVEAKGLRAHRAGEVVDVGEAGVVEWQEIRDGRLAASRVETTGKLVELDRIGLWSTGDDFEGSSLLLSRGETDLAGGGVEEEGDGEKTGAVGVPQGIGRFLRGEMTQAILVLLVFLLVVESWLFHRYAVY